jgi:ELWxxDGT repeat protein
VSGGYPDRLTGVNGTLFFAAYDATHGVELWKSDGTGSGTVLVADIGVGPNASLPSGLTSVDGFLVFLADDGDHGRELWRSDGTPHGTVMGADINPGAAHAFFSGYTTNFVSYTGMLGGPRIPTYPDGKGLFGSRNGILFFGADDGVHGTELWRSDGTAGGTRLVADINPGPGGSGPWNFISAGGTLFFSADFGSGSGGQLWKTDGTAAGTVRLRGGFRGGMSSFTEAGGRLFFVTSEGVHGFEVWTSDGTPAGTVLVKDINPNTHASSGAPSPAYLASVDGTLFFTHSDAQGVELWKSDGTEDGTVIVADIDAHLGSSYPYGLTNVNGTLFFFRERGAARRTELWKTDGTEDGTVMVAIISAGLGGVLGATAVSGALLFFADDGIHGRELWRSDGTPEGTGLLADIKPGPGASDPPFFFLGFPPTNVAGIFGFVADDGVHGAEVWRSDGTGAGTTLVADIKPGPDTSTPRLLAGANGALFFAADDGVHGLELWQAVQPLGLTLNQGTFAPGDTLQGDVSVTNVGSEGWTSTSASCFPLMPAGDLGCRGGDAAAFVADGFARVVLSCLSGSPQGFAPLYRASLIPDSLRTTIPGFLTFVWNSSLGLHAVPGRDAARCPVGRGDRCGRSARLGRGDANARPVADRRTARLPASIGSPPRGPPPRRTRRWDSSSPSGSTSSRRSWPASSSPGSCTAWREGWRGRGCLTAGRSSSRWRSSAGSRSR